jgi:hypothetical protein
MMINSWCKVTMKMLHKHYLPVKCKPLLYTGYCPKCELRNSIKIHCRILLHGTSDVSVLCSILERLLSYINFIHKTCLSFLRTPCNFTWMQYASVTKPFLSYLQLSFPHIFRFINAAINGIRFTATSSRQ